MGHELAFAVERGKIAVNSGSKDPAIKLDVLEAGLAVQLSDALVADSLNDHTSRLETGVQEALRLADLTAEQIDRVVYVGGSSLMAIVPETMRRVFPDAEHSFASVLPQWPKVSRSWQRERACNRR